MPSKNKIYDKTKLHKGYLSSRALAEAYLRGDLNEEMFAEARAESRKRARQRPTRPPSKKLATAMKQANVLGMSAGGKRLSTQAGLTLLDVFRNDVRHFPKLEDFEK